MFISAYYNLTLALEAYIQDLNSCNLLTLLTLLYFERYGWAKSGRLSAG